ncbi:MAG: EamA family transporter [Candidatus Omnitrophica bacterium]|nr:EamA family transporter [Candidatus Omnitrophota bacterium]
MSAFLWAVLTACIWGVVPLMEKLGLGAVSPTAGVMVRSLGVVFGLLLFGFFGRPWLSLRGLGWSSILWLVSGGFLASFVGQLAFYRALKSGAVSQITPVAGAYPLVAAILGWVVLREPLTAARALGVVCVIVGVFLLRR